MNLKSRLELLQVGNLQIFSKACLLLLTYLAYGRDTCVGNLISNFKVILEKEILFTKRLSDWKTSGLSVVGV